MKISGFFIILSMEIHTFLDGFLLIQPFMYDYQGNIQLLFLYGGL
tara:strand:+ start:324 stop:458 length:135 start_codon:yes stop_codon:yes gene_type:complete